LPLASAWLATAAAALGYIVLLLAWEREDVLQLVKSVAARSVA
jgi:hypothetical protein